MHSTVRVCMSVFSSLGSPTEEESSEGLLKCLVAELKLFTSDLHESPTVMTSY